MRSLSTPSAADYEILKPSRPDELAVLGDRHLLFLLLGRNAVTSSAAVEALFDRFGDLGAIASADLPELARTSGLGAAALTDLKLCRLLSERLARAEAARRPTIGSWSALLAYVKVALADLPREEFRALFLDRRNRLLRDELIAYDGQPAGSSLRTVVSLKHGTPEPRGSIQPFNEGCELVYGRAPTFLKSHFLMLAPVRRALVQHMGRIPCAVSLGFKFDDRGQRQPRLNWLPAFGQGRGPY